MKKIMMVIIYIFIFSNLFANINLVKTLGIKFNPALIDYNKNNVYFESSFKFNYLQPFISSTDLFKNNIILDLNKIYHDLNGKDAIIILDADYSLLFKVKIKSLSYANNIYIYSDNYAFISNDLLKLISEGNKTDSDSTSFLGKSYINSYSILENNNYISYTKNENIFSITISKFIPLFVLKNNISINNDYNLDKGHFDFEYFINGNIYTPVSIAEYFNTDIISLYSDLFKDAGYKLNLSYINTSKRFGISLNDLIISTATLNYDYNLIGKGYIINNNLNILSNFSNSINNDNSSIEYPRYVLDLPINISYFTTIDYILLNRIKFQITPYYKIFLKGGSEYGMIINNDNNIFNSLYLNLSKKMNFWFLESGFTCALYFMNLDFSILNSSFEVKKLLSLKNLSFKINLSIER